MKLKGIIVIVSVMVIASIILPGCGDGGVPTITSATAPQTARLSGTVYVPTGVSGARVAGRVASVVGQDTPLTGANVTIKRMNSNGTLESIGDDFTATTDSNGQYTIEDVPVEENVIIEATKGVSINGNPKTLTLKKVTSVTESDSTAGAVSNLNLDVATTLGAEAMKDIVVTANQGIVDADRITGADLPRETIADIESGIVTALTADQTSGSPAVNLSTVIKDGDTAADAQLTNLEDSASGTTVKNLKGNASTKGSLRIVVTITGSSVALEGATVIVTNDGNVQTKSTDANGEAFFDGITTGTTLAVEVKKEGYVLGKASKKIEKAAVVHVAKIEMTATVTNQAPVAKAGPDQSVLQHATVTLDGSSSFDPDGTSITYSWTQTSGTAVSLSSATAAQPTFTAAAADTLTFSLTVSDGNLTSEVDTVSITVGAVACTTDADCDDSSALTIDACTNAGTTSSACGHTVIACNSNTDCEDNNADTADSCVNGGTTNASCSNASIACHTDADCADNNALTIDACSNGGTAVASCSNTGIVCNTNADCDDTNALTLDTCSNGGMAVASCSNTGFACNADTDCDDGIETTYDQCNNGGTTSATCEHIDMILNEWITIPAGDFIMGCSTGDSQCQSSESPKHTVSLSEYKIQKYEVTEGQYKTCVNAGICNRGCYIETEVNHPAPCVNWTQANTYCAWIGGRLPTEAEWEKAARGPSPRENIYPWGNTAPDCTLLNYYNGTNYCVGIGSAAVVGSYPTGASYYGALDMAGNVWEWVNDWYDDTYYATSPATDPQGPATGTNRVSRGGAFYLYAEDTRVSFRSLDSPTYAGIIIGFRCAQD